MGGRGAGTVAGAAPAASSPTASTARACRRAAAAVNGPAGSSTTNALVPGNLWFCHDVAVPRDGGRTRGGGAGGAPRGGGSALSAPGTQRTGGGGRGGPTGTA